MISTTPGGYFKTFKIGPYFASIGYSVYYFGVMTDMDENNSEERLLCMNDFYGVCYWNSDIHLGGDEKTFNIQPFLCKYWSLSCLLRKYDKYG